MSDHALCCLIYKGQPHMIRWLELKRAKDGENSYTTNVTSYTTNVTSYTTIVTSLPHKTLNEFMPTGIAGSHGYKRQQCRYSFSRDRQVRSTTQLQGLITYSMLLVLREISRSRSTCVEVESPNIFRFCKYRIFIKQSYMH